jgi:hypothetical protein
LREDVSEASGKTNVLVLPCQSILEAAVVANNARSRDDQDNVQIVADLSVLDPDESYVQLKTREDYPRWYEPNAFVERSSEPTAEPSTGFMYVLQGYYGSGWEDLTASDDQDEIERDLQAYRENEGRIYRIVYRYGEA